MKTGFGKFNQIPLDVIGFKFFLTGFFRQGRRFWELVGAQRLNSNWHDVVCLSSYFSGAAAAFPIDLLIFHNLYHCLMQNSTGFNSLTMNFLLKVSTRCPMPSALCRQCVLNPGHGLLNIFVVVERTEADVAHAAFAETRARSADHSGFFEQTVKKFPGIRLAVHPDVR